MEADITSLDVEGSMEGDIGFEVSNVGARWESTSILLTWGECMEAYVRFLHLGKCM